MANEEVKVEKSMLTHVALGVSRDDKTGIYTIVEIKYNPNTSAVGMLKKIPVGSNKGDSDERFKILAADYDLVG